jgi:hypothetical protein
MPSNTELCPTCRTAVHFVTGPRGGALCPVCGALAASAGPAGRPGLRTSAEGEDGGLETLARARPGRRVIDVDSNPRKGSFDRSRTPQRTAGGRRDTGPRSVTGALDGSPPRGSGSTLASIPTHAGTGTAPAGAPGSSGTRFGDGRVSGSTRGAREDDGGLQTLLARWRTLTDGVTSRDGRPWREHGRYAAGDIILHTRHGMGVVERVGDDGTVDVLFRGGYQRLATSVRSAESPATP